jgi:RHS repeat-associated protein
LANAAAVNVATAITWKPMSDLVSGMTHGNGLATTAGYYLDHRLTSLQLVNGAGLVPGTAYSYGDNLSLTGITDQVTAANTNTLTYTAANRLASASGAWGSNSFTYDAVGNRLTDVTAAATRVAGYAATSNRITGMTENAAVFRTYSHDTAGNIITDVRPGEAFAYTYNKRNRLASVTRNSVAYATYVYNAMEQLASRTTSAVGGPVGTVHYIYDLDGHLIAEANGATGATTREYLWLPANDNNNDTLAESALPQLAGGGAQGAEGVDLPLAVVNVSATPVMFHVHTDHLGRPIRMTDAAKATVWQATWKPWGEAQSITGTQSNNLRFPGQYFQIETNLAYNWHRHYDPVTGRYTQPDPLRFIDGPSVYAYAGGSPWMNVDPRGQYAFPPLPAPVLGPALPPTLPLSPLIPLPGGPSLGPEPYTPIPSPEGESTPGADNKHYHRVCDQPPPPGLDRCDLARWKLGRAKACVTLRKDWRDKYGPNPHDNQIQQREREIQNLEREVQQHCAPIACAPIPLPIPLLSSN